MVKKIDCFIPCRTNGDFIKNLNFLELDKLKLVEHTIIKSVESKLFSNIYLLTNDEISFFNLKKKYKYLKIIKTKSKKEPFHKIIEKLIKKKNFASLVDICVLLPNFPFKSTKTILKVHNKYKKNNLNFIATAKKDFFFYYFLKKKKYESINYLKNINDRKKILPLNKLAGGIFIYNCKNTKFDFYTMKKENLFFINEHEAFGIYSLYDFITASSLVDIDQSILLKMLR
jgi:CMP-N-acetylneuraminic acid synthetase